MTFWNSFRIGLYQNLNISCEQREMINLKPIPSSSSSSCSISPLQPHCQAGGHAALPGSARELGPELGLAGDSMIIMMTLPEGQLSKSRLAQFKLAPKLHCAPNCIVPLQIAQVQVSTELLEVSGKDSKDSSPKTVLPKLCLRNLPAIAPQPQGRLRPLRRRAQR